jgi:hypothetical protein
LKIVYGEPSSSIPRTFNVLLSRSATCMYRFSVNGGGVNFSFYITFSITVSILA